MNPEAARNEFHSSNSKISPKQRFAIAAFRNWTELFQHAQTKHAGILDVQPRGLIGLQHLWPPERRFDIQLDELGTVGRNSRCTTLFKQYFAWVIWLDHSFRI